MRPEDARRRHAARRYPALPAGAAGPRPRGRLVDHPYSWTIQTRGQRHAAKRQNARKVLCAREPCTHRAAALRLRHDAACREPRRYASLKGHFVPRAAPCADAQTDLCAHPHSPVAHAEGVLKGAREAQGAVACDCVVARARAAFGTRTHLYTPGRPPLAVAAA